jgi:hypothetical protein
MAVFNLFVRICLNNLYLGLYDALRISTVFFFNGISLTEYKNQPLIVDEHMLGDGPGRWPEAE